MSVQGALFVISVQLFCISVELFVIVWLLAR